MTTLSRLHFADSVSHALSHFAHTGNPELLDKATLTEIYNEARNIIEEETVASHLNKAEATTAQPLQIEDMKQGKIERDYEPEQSYGTAHDFQEHTRFGGTREDY